MKRKIHLHGELADKFGEQFSIQCETLRQGIGILDANFRGDFRKTLREIGPCYIVHEYEGEMTVSLPGENEAAANYNLGSVDVHIIPEASGAGSRVKGAIMIVAAVVLIAYGQGWATSLIGSASASTATTWTLLGVSIGLSGLANVINPMQQMSSSGKDGKDRNESALINGYANVSTPGVAMPLIYGEVITGSVLVSGEIEVLQQTSVPQGPGAMGTVAAPFSVDL